MNRLFAVPALAALLGGCAVIPVPLRSTQPVPDAAWLQGSWLAIEPGGDEFPLACQSDAPVTFRPGGSFVTYGDQGRWSIRGDRLTVATVSSDAERGGRGVVSVERVDRDTMRQRAEDARVTLFRRCPAAR